MRCSSILAALLFCGCSTIAQAADCRSELTGDTAVHPVRDITPDDLARLRDVGDTIGYVRSDSPFTVSPDGKRIAFQLRRGDPVGNAYCLGIVVADTDGSQPPRLVDVGGEIILAHVPVHGVGYFEQGIGVLILPKWSPDGSSVAYLRRDDGRTQLWVASLDGKAAAVTASSLDPVDFGWSADGKSLWFETQPGLEEQRAKIAEEGKRGWAYDGRFWPISEAGAQPMPPFRRSRYRVDRSGGEVAQLPGDDAGPRPGNEDLPAGASSVARSPDDERAAWLAPAEPELYNSRSLLHVRVGGRDIACATSVCGEGVAQFWWVGDGTRLAILREEGVAGVGSNALYLWDPATTRPATRVVGTDDLLTGCVLAGDMLVCGREGANQPRRIVAIDPLSGKQHLILDPNPEFRSLGLGEVKRLSWQTAGGREAFGDLVLPPDYKEGQRLPLVITQYRSRGFLRGGTGDDYPIFPLAARGFAVLSFDRSSFYADGRGAKNVEEWARLNNDHLADRRQTFGSLESGIRAVERLGVIDMSKIGLTGFSDGNTTMAYGLINSKLFAAAATSSCCDDPMPFYSLVGPNFERNILSWGFPTPEEDSKAYWARLSISRNAARIDTPILMQLSDGELRIGLEAYGLLKRAGKPVDLWVLPGEYHNRWQPAHRLAIYERSIAWFDFWLRGIVPDAPVERERWCALAIQRTDAIAGCPR